jgi:mevalonate kinase
MAAQAKRHYKANGKLLLTGEYLVLNGAVSLALPCKLGQSMTITERPGSEIVWKAYDRNGELWFSGHFDLMAFDPIDSTDEQTAKNIRKLLRAACRQNSEFLSQWRKYMVETHLEFDRNWGLGSSSTLVWCVAQWAEVNPYLLLFDSFGGSGYDIACADAEGPVLYQLLEDELHINSADFDPPFKDKLYLVYLGHKQSSSDALKQYQSAKGSLNGSVDKVSRITESVNTARSLEEFESLVRQHESIISDIIGKPTVQSEYFEDYWGCVKSLGAWGGDFVLVTSTKSEAETRAYFQGKGLDTVFRYGELVLH